MGVYDDEIQTAKDLISEAGQAVTWRQLANGTPADPSQPWNVGASGVTDYPVVIVFLPAASLAFLSYISNTEVH